MTGDISILKQISDSGRTPLSWADLPPDLLEKTCVGVRSLAWIMASFQAPGYVDRRPLCAPRDGLPGTDLGRSRRFRNSATGRSRSPLLSGQNRIFLRLWNGLSCLVSKNGWIDGHRPWIV